MLILTVKICNNSYFIQVLEGIVSYARRLQHPPETVEHVEVLAHKSVDNWERGYVEVL